MNPTGPLEAASTVTPDPPGPRPDRAWSDDIVAPATATDLCVPPTERDARPTADVLSELREDRL